MTYLEAYLIEYEIAGGYICPHGNPTTDCLTSTCYIRNPIEKGQAPHAEMPPEVEAHWRRRISEQYPGASISEVEIDPRRREEWTRWLVDWEQQLANY